MPIVSSSWTAESHAQADGRVWLRETHTDSTGKVWTFDYLRGPGMDADAIMADRVAQVNDMLVQNEIDGLLSDGA